MQKLRQPPRAALATKAYVGATNAWTNLAAFNAMLKTFETAYGSTHAVVIQSYVKWRETIAAKPVITVVVAFSLVSPLIGGEIVFDAKPTSTYIVLYSSNLCHW